MVLTVYFVFVFMKICSDNSLLSIRFKCLIFFFLYAMQRKKFSERECVFIGTLSSLIHPMLVQGFMLVSTYLSISTSNYSLKDGVDIGNVAIKTASLILMKIYSSLKQWESVKAFNI